MGRPRKRQFIDTANDDPVSYPPTESLEADPMPRIVDDYGYPSDTGTSQPFYINSQSDFGLSPEAAEKISVPHFAAGNGDLHDIWHFGDRMTLGDINFESHSDATIDPLLDQAPALSSGSNNSVSDDGRSQSKIPLGPCGCLASMYLALASLQQLPTDIVQALRTVRQAGMTASATVWCPQCGAVLVEKPEPPIAAFQNTMLLGTLIPIIANAYKRLLEMIDEETNTAEALGQMKNFRFHDYGGLCPKQMSIEATMACVEKEMMFNAVDMPPMQWRTTVRALLRVDIYGHEQEGFMHRGLKVLVADVEQRQRARHTWLDSHPDAGNMDIGFGKKHCVGDQTHVCLTMLEVAKQAIDQLVIA